MAKLKSLRQFAKAIKETQGLIGFGNPLLLGPDGNDRRAWERQRFKPPSALAQAAIRSVRSAIPINLVDVEEARAQYPLPETADELCAVAQSNGAGLPWRNASETTIKTLSANRILDSCRTALHTPRSLFTWRSRSRLRCGGTQVR